MGYFITALLFQFTAKCAGERILKIDQHLAKLKPNSITLAGSELAQNMFRASSELASVMEFGREPASSC